MGLNDVIVKKLTDKYIPRLIEVIESMHGQMELNNKILQEVWIELKRKHNPVISEKECREFTDEVINEHKKSIQ